MAEDKSTATGIESDAIQPPTGKLLKESLSVLQVPRLAFRTPSLLFQAPRGTNQPVLMIPGLKAGDASNAPMRSFLRRKNFQVWGWGLGTNNGDVPGQLPNVVARAEELFERAGEPVALIGWSLGGVLARELARERPELVSQVITYGTPVIGGPLYTAVSGVYTQAERRQIARQVAERNRIPIEVPITALYSKRDGIVAWEACIDDFSPDVTMIEIRSTHVGMGIDPDVWQIVSERLVA